MRQVVFDLETTGFSFAGGDRIVEIGAVELIHGAVTGRTFHTYVNPERDMPDGAYQVHGLSTKFLKDKPVFASIARAFCAFVGGAQLIAHNGESFDLPFLNAELAAVGLPTLGNELYDTLHAARRKYPGSPASLDALCMRFGIDTTARARDGHGALLDSRLLAAVYIELTGGAQAGLNFASTAPESEIRINGFAAARPRPTPLPSFLTTQEALAHEAFIASLGEATLWRRLAQAAE